LRGRELVSLANALGSPSLPKNKIVAGEKCRPHCNPLSPATLAALRASSSSLGMSSCERAPNSYRASAPFRASSCRSGRSDGGSRLSVGSSGEVVGPVVGLNLDAESFEAREWSMIRPSVSGRASPEVEMVSRGASRQSAPITGGGARRPTR
jgi:hypothetical protein